MGRGRKASISMDRFCRLLPAYNPVTCGLACHATHERLHEAPGQPPSVRLACTPTGFACMPIGHFHREFSCLKRGAV